MSRGLLDTSVFMATEGGRPLGALPAEGAVSVVTMGELELGVLAADSDAVRARRAQTLALARAADPIPVIEATMSHFARLVHLPGGGHEAHRAGCDHRGDGAPARPAGLHPGR